MEFSVDFFRDEIREGFYIPTAIKQTWAASLNVLAEIDRVCKKHGIKYFADCGTLIGCVRHGGFVPWDDDLDIGMCREDYRRFREVADAELPKDFVIHDYERQEGHWLFLARVVNRQKICFEPGYLNEHYNFPWLVGVDIFLKDHLYEEPGKEKERDDEVLRIMAVADSIVDGTLKAEAKEYWLAELEKKYNTRIERSLDDRHMGIELYRLAEQQLGRLSGKDSHTMGQIFPLIMKGHKELPDYFYERVIQLPFENGTIPVTAGYHAFLLSDYHDYLSVFKQGGAHCYPYFEGQKKELYEQTGLVIPGYSYDPSIRERGASEDVYRASLKGLVEDCIRRFKELYAIVIQPAINEDDRLNALEEGQQLAADLGEVVDAVKGEASDTAKRVAAALQAYCDAVFAVSEDPEATVKMKESLTELCCTLEECILQRREILFLTTGPELWEGFRYFYEEESREDADVYVIELPLLFKDCYGRVLARERGGASSEETCSGRYSSDIKLTQAGNYDLMLHYPERIYIQDAYDGENPCLSIPPEFYASEIRDHCRELVLVPALTPEEFASEALKEMYNMGAYVTVPGVVYADRVVLKAEWLKERYLEKLCAWAGEDTREYWERKIQVLPASEEGIPEVFGEKLSEGEKDDKAAGRCGKRILYMVGLDGLVLQGEEYVRNLTKKIDELSDDPETEQIIFSYYPPSREEWIRNVPELDREVRAIVEKYSQETGAEVTEHERIKAEDYDMYYGSASPAALAFRLAKKELYLLDYDEVVI